jgi:ankyrin repeat protein
MTLNEAIENKDYNATQTALQNGCCVVNEGPHNERTLYKAIESGDKRIVEAVLGSGAEIVQRYAAIMVDRTTRVTHPSNLEQAIDSGNSQIVSAILKAGAKVFNNPVRNHLGDTIAHKSTIQKAIDSKDSKIVEAVLEADAQVQNEKISYEEILLQAIRSKHIEIIDLVIRAGQRADNKNGTVDANNIQNSLNKALHTSLYLSRSEEAITSNRGGISIKVLPLLNPTRSIISDLLLSKGADPESLPDGIGAIKQELLEIKSQLDSQEIRLSEEEIQTSTQQNSSVQFQTPEASQPATTPNLTPRGAKRSIADLLDKENQGTNKEPKLR